MKIFRNSEIKSNVNFFNEPYALISSKIEILTAYFNLTLNC